MLRIAMGLEYDGSAFHGWQRQAKDISIQAVVEKALSKVAGHPVQITASGRTDAGVHAVEQVIHFDTPQARSDKAWVYGANSSLPGAIRVLWARVVHSHFNARRKATSREYRYVIYNHPIRPSLYRNYVSWHYKFLDVELMLKAAAYWVGKHDFSAFRATSCQSLSPIRDVQHIHIRRLGYKVIIDIKANAFLHHMVRNIVGVLIKIGSRERDPDWAKEVLDSKNRNHGANTAPPEGLYLKRVFYPEEYHLPLDPTTQNPWETASSEPWNNEELI